MREFLHVDDLADACVRLMTHYSGEGVVNVGAGYDLTIMELAEMICEVVGFNGAIRFDSTKPDGTPRKLLDISRIRTLGWAPRIELRKIGSASGRERVCQYGERSVVVVSCKKK